MPSLLEERLEAIDATEVHWSTGTILAAFFAASLISAVFFGLGYSLGRGGTAKPVFGMASSDSGVAPDVMYHSAPSLAAVPDSTQRAFNHALYSNATASAVHAKRTAASYRSSADANPAHVATRQVSATQTRRAAIVPAKTVKPATVHTVHTAHAGTARYMVQVGAIGNRKDARMLVSQLRKKGFHAGIYPGRHDKYLHIQIGPFTSTQQAQTVRRHVMASGYRAILKQAS